MYDEDDITMWI